MKDTNKLEPGKNRPSLGRKTLKDLEPGAPRQHQARGGMSSGLSRQKKDLASTAAASYSRSGG